MFTERDSTASDEFHPRQFLLLVAALSECRILWQGFFLD
jgi:hypothetical protein